MPERITVNYTGGVHDITESGSYFVAQIASFLQAGNHTLVYSTDTTETFSPKYSRIANPTPYTQSHRVLQKTLGNGDTIYIEVFNTMSDVSLDLGYFFDTQFICVSVGHTYALGQITDRSNVVAYPLDWAFVTSLSAQDYTTLDTALSTLYEGQYNNATIGTDASTRLYVVDTDYTTAFGWVTREQDIVSDSDIRINTQMINVIGLADSHPTYGSVLVKYNVTPAFLIDYNTALADIFSTHSGYYSPETNWLDLVDNSGCYYYTGVDWARISMPTLSYLYIDDTAFYADTLGNHPTGSATNSIQTHRGWATRVFLGRSRLSNIIYTKRKVVPSIDPSSHLSFNASTFMAEVDTLSGKALLYNTGVNLTVTSSIFPTLSNFTQVGFGSVSYVSLDGYTYV